jgi:excinuclease ABC subunit A
MAEYIQIQGARQNNLKDISVDIPRHSFVVVTGVSGAGKSSLVYETVFAEAQRLFLENLSLSARQFLEQLRRPDVDRIHGLSPALAVRQTALRSSLRSTIGTYTDIYDFVRILYSRLGELWCDSSQAIVRSYTALEVAQEIVALEIGTRVYIQAPLELPSESQRPDWLRSIVAQGFTRAVVESEELLLEDVTAEKLQAAHSFQLVIDRILVKPEVLQRAEEAVQLAYQQTGGIVEIRTQQGDGAFSQKRYSKSLVCDRCGLQVVHCTPTHFSFNSPLGVCERCQGTGTNSENAIAKRCLGEPDTPPGFCTSCGGSRLAAPARLARFGSLSLVDLITLPLQKIPAALETQQIRSVDTPIATPLLAEIYSRVATLVDLGLGELPIGRSLQHLSRGELQRVQLAGILGSDLSGVLYIFDEPTSGLHPNQVSALVAALRSLVASGNSVVVVEHDLDVIRAADIVVELGPGAGNLGGELIACCPPSKLTELPQSLTGQFLSGRQNLRRQRRPDIANTEFVSIALPQLSIGTSIRLPLNAVTVVTGLSGSGKTRFLQNSVIPHFTVRGEAHPDDTSSVGQYQVVDFSEGITGITARSIPATIVGVFDPIRDLFASLTDSKSRGWGNSRFSFNVKGGRCEQCSGSGERKLAIEFLPELQAVCESCEGARYSSTTLEIKFKGYSIGDVLKLTVEQALPIFAAIPKIQRKLTVVSEIGLGYITLGQSAESLSGGELQRLRLSAELSKVTKGPTVYVFDEPSLGLHSADIQVILEIFDRLIHQGHTIVVAEHMLEFAAVADWIIECSPTTLNAGTPKEHCLNRDSLTGALLQARRLITLD